MTVLELAAQSVKVHEGLELKPYRCSAGKLTVGYGRNLEDVGISRAEAEMLLERDLHQALSDARSLVSTFDAMNTVRQAVLVEMAFNLGKARLSGFRNMLAALDKHDYRRAAHDMLDSKWAVQVGTRATTLARRMEAGV